MTLIAAQTKRLIVGLGLTGLSCARHLLKLGLPFEVADSRSQPPGLQELCALIDVPVHLGPLTAELLCRYDELLVAPGISLRDPAFQAAREQGVRISGDLDVFCEASTAPIIAITGSNGKSTVTTLVGQMMQDAGVRTAVGGNLGVPMLDLLSSDIEAYVLELSSFQLERCSQLRARVACMLNLSEDHLDHHGDMRQYHAAKQRIYRQCESAVSNRDDALTQPLIPDETAHRRFSLRTPEPGDFGIIEQDGVPHLATFQQPLMAVSELPFVGQHNWANALAALAIGSEYGLPMSTMLDSLRNFKPLPHRCESLGERAGLRWVNDSKATNAGAALAAVKGLAAEHNGQSSLVLLAGGRGKGDDYQALMDELARCGRALVAMGETGNELIAAMGERLPCKYVQDMSEAVSAAVELAEAGDTVLLSPAAASFDQYRSFEHRGDRFRECVMALQGGAHG